MRGKPTIKAFSADSIGITPAYAGKTALYAKWDGMEKDHPRVCGENHTLGFPIFARGGSPPRMRGKPVFSTIFSASVRITPAYAGKTGSGLKRVQYL